jgi:hypothetical protein
MAGFHSLNLKTLDAFDFAFQPSFTRARIIDLASLAFVTAGGS